MTVALRVYLADGWPDRREACEWALVEDGRVVRRGCSAAAHWPMADAVEGMLDPSLVGCHVVRLPVVPRAEHHRTAAYAYALEDRLPDDPDRYHFAVGAESPAGTRVVAVARARLTDLLGTFRRLGRRLDRLVAAAEVLPATGGDWLLWRSPADTLVLQAGAHGTCPIDSVADLAPLMAGAAPPPERLRLIAGCDLATGVVAGVPVVDGGRFDWAAADWDCAIDALVGEFRPLRRAGDWRRALLLAAIAVGLYTTISLGEWGWLAWRQAALNRAIEDIAAKALPGQPLVAPLAQLANAAGVQQHRRGESAIGDFVFLAERSAALAGDKPVQAFDYESGRLTMQLDGLDPDRETAVRQALAAAGLELRVARRPGAVRVAVAVDAGVRP